MSSTPIPPELQPYVSAQIRAAVEAEREKRKEIEEILGSNLELLQHYNAVAAVRAAFRKRGEE